jgi:hypothetical protein
MGEVRPDEGGAAGFRALAQAKLQFSTPPARAQRDLPLHGRPDGGNHAPNNAECGEYRIRNILRRPRKKESAEKLAETFLDPEDEKACEAARGAFNVLFEASGVRIFTASHLDLSHRWVPFLVPYDLSICNL